MNRVKIPGFPPARSLKPLTAAIAAFFLIAGAYAQTTYTWTSTGSNGTWTTVADWNPAPPSSGPGPLDTATNGTDVGHNLNLAQGATSVGTLTAGSVAGNFPIISASGSTAVVFTVGAINQNNASSLLIRDNTAAEDLDVEVGTINVSTGVLGLGSSTAGEALFQLNSATASAAVNVSGGTLNLNVLSDYNLGLITASGTSGTITLIDNADPATTPTRNVSVAGLKGTAALTINGADGSQGGNAALHLTGSGIYLSNVFLADGTALPAVKSLSLSVELGAGGVQTLTGPSTFTGATTVVSGKLYVSNLTGGGLGSGAAAVQSGAILGGTGTLAPGAGKSVTVNGTLTAGDLGTTGAGAFTPGMLTLNLSGSSQLIFGSGSHLALTLGGAGGSSASIGFASRGNWLGGPGQATLDITDGGSLQVGASYPVFQNVTTAAYSLAGVTYNGAALTSSQYALTFDGSNYRIAVLSTTTAPPGTAKITTAPVAVSAAAGRTVSFSVTATGTGPLSYQWYRNGVALAGQTDRYLIISNVSAANAGSYTCGITDSTGLVMSAAAALSVSATAAPARLINLSVLTLDGPGGQLLTLGFVTNGAGAGGMQNLLIRGSGPALQVFGVASPLPDPTLTLFSGTTSIASNDNWGAPAANQPLVTAADAATGAFALTDPAGLDAALVTALATNQGYTVQIAGKAGATGNALAEVYDDPSGTPTAATPRLVNLSCTQQVIAGGNLTAGFTIGGAAAETVLIRVTGPALGAAPFNLAGTMPDPTLTVFSGQTAIAANAVWGGDPQIAAADTAVGAFPLNNLAGKDSALLLTLPPGPYTVQAKSASAVAGTALIEIYEVP